MFSMNMMEQAPIQNLYPTSYERSPWLSHHKISLQYASGTNQWDVNSILEHNFFNQGSPLMGYYREYDSGQRVSRLVPYAFGVHGNDVQMGRAGFRKNIKLKPGERERLSPMFRGNLAHALDPTNVHSQSLSNMDRYRRSNIIYRGETQAREGFLTSVFTGNVPFASGGGYTYGKARYHFGHDITIDTPSRQVSGLVNAQGEMLNFADLAAGTLSLDNSKVGQWMHAGQKFQVGTWQQGADTDPIPLFVQNSRRRSYFAGLNLHTTPFEGEMGATEPMYGKKVTPDYLQNRYGISANDVNLNTTSSRGIYLTAQMYDQVSASMKGPQGIKMGMVPVAGIGNAPPGSKVGVDYVTAEVKSGELALETALGTYKRSQQVDLINFSFGKKRGGAIMRRMGEGTMHSDQLGQAWADLEGNPALNQYDFFGSMLTGLQSKYGKLSGPQKDAFYNKYEMAFGVNDWVNMGDISMGHAELYSDYVRQTMPEGSKVSDHFRFSDVGGGRLQGQFRLQGDIFRQISQLAPEYTGNPTFNWETLFAINQRFPVLSNRLGITPDHQNISSNRSVEGWRAMFQSHLFNRNPEQIQHMSGGTRLSQKQAAQMASYIDMNTGENPTDEAMHGVVGDAMEYAGVKSGGEFSPFIMGNTVMASHNAALAADKLEGGQGQSRMFKRWMGSFTNSLTAFGSGGSDAEVAMAQGRMRSYLGSIFDSDAPSDLMKKILGRQIPGTVFGRYELNNQLKLNELGFTHSGLEQMVLSSDIAPGQRGEALKKLKQFTSSGQLGVMSDRFPFQGQSEIAIWNAKMMKNHPDIGGWYAPQPYSVMTTGDWDEDPGWVTPLANWNAKSKKWQSIVSPQELKKMTGDDRIGLMNQVLTDKFALEAQKYDVALETVQDWMKEPGGLKKTFNRQDIATIQPLVQSYLSGFGTTGVAYNTYRTLMATAGALGRDKSAAQEFMALSYNKAFDAESAETSHIVNMLGSVRFDAKGEMRAFSMAKQNRTGPPTKLQPNTPSFIREKMISAALGDLYIPGDKRQQRGFLSTGGIASVLSYSDDNALEIKDALDRVQLSGGTTRDYQDALDRTVGSEDDQINDILFKRALDYKGAERTRSYIGRGYDNYPERAFDSKALIGNQTLSQIEVSPGYKNAMLIESALKRKPGSMISQAIGALKGVFAAGGGIAEMAQNFFRGQLTPGVVARMGTSVPSTGVPQMDQVIQESGVEINSSELSRRQQGPTISATLGSEGTAGTPVSPPGGVGPAIPLPVSGGGGGMSSGGGGGGAPPEDPPDDIPVTGGDEYWRRMQGLVQGAQVRVNFAGKHTDPTRGMDRIRGAQTMIRGLPREALDLHETAKRVAGQMGVPTAGRPMSAVVGDAMAMDPVGYLSQMPRDAIKYLNKTTMEATQALDILDNGGGFPSDQENETARSAIQAFTDPRTNAGKSREVAGQLNASLQALGKTVEKLDKQFEGMSETGEKYQKVMDDHLKTLSDDKSTPSDRRNAMEGLQTASLEQRKANLQAQRMQISSAMGTLPEDSPERAKLQNQLRGVQGELGSTQMELDQQAQFGKGNWARRLVGGWGLFYMSHLAKLGASNIMEGYGETQAMSQKQGALAASYFGSGTYRPSTIEMDYQNAMARAGGFGQMGARGLSTPFIGTPFSTAVGAAKTGVGAAVLGGYIADTVGATLGGAALGYIGAGAGAAYIGADYMSRAMNPEEAITQMNQQMLHGDTLWKERGDTLFGSLGAMAQWAGADWNRMAVGSEALGTPSAQAQAVGRQAVQNAVQKGLPVNFGAMTQQQMAAFSQLAPSAITGYDNMVTQRAAGAYALHKAQTPFGGAGFDQYLQAFAGSPNIEQYAGQSISAMGGVPTAPGAGEMAGWMVENGLVDESQQARYAAGVEAYSKIPYMQEMIYASGQSPRDAYKNIIPADFGDPKKNLPQSARLAYATSVGLSVKLGGTSATQGMSMLSSDVFGQYDNLPAGVLKDVSAQLEYTISGQQTQVGVMDYLKTQGIGRQEAQGIARGWGDQFSNAQRSSLASQAIGATNAMVNMGYLTPEGVAQAMDRLGDMSAAGITQMTRRMAGISQDNPYYLAKYFPQRIQSTSIYADVGLNAVGDPSQVYAPGEANLGFMTGAGTVMPAQDVAAATWGSDWASTDPYGFRGAGVNGYQMPSGRTIYGTSAMQMQYAQTSYGLSMASIGNSMAQLNLDYQYNIMPGGFWDIQDQMTQLGRQQQQWSFEYQQKQMELSSSQFGEQQAFQSSQFYRQQEMQSSQFYDSMALNKRGMQMSRDYTMEQWGFQDQLRDLQWQWKQEDYGEEVRFLTGRQRRKAETGMERATIMHEMEGDQFEKQKEHQQELWNLEDERFQLQLQHFEESKKLQEELFEERQELETKHFEEQQELQKQNLEKMQQFYKERTKLEDQQTKLQREMYEKQYELQKQALGIQAAQADAAYQYKVDMEEFEQWKKDQLDQEKVDMETRVTEWGASVDAVFNNMAVALNELDAKIEDIRRGISQIY